MVPKYQLYDAVVSFSSIFFLLSMSSLSTLMTPYRADITSTPNNVIAFHLLLVPTINSMTSTSVGTVNFSHQIEMITQAPTSSLPMTTVIPKGRIQWFASSPIHNRFNMKMIKFWMKNQLNSLIKCTVIYKEIWLHEKERNEL